MRNELDKDTGFLVAMMSVTFIVFGFGLLLIDHRSGDVWKDGQPTQAKILSYTSDAKGEAFSVGVRYHLPEVDDTVRTAKIFGKTRETLRIGDTVPAKFLETDRGVRVSFESSSPVKKIVSLLLVISGLLIARNYVRLRDSDS